MVIGDSAEFAKDLAKMFAYAGFAIFCILMIWATIRPYLGDLPPDFPIGFRPAT